MRNVQRLVERRRVQAFGTRNGWVMKGEGGVSMAGKQWSEEELEFLKENYVSKNSCAMIAEKLGRGVRAVYSKANRLGLRVKWDYRRVDKDGYVELVLGSSLKTREHRYVYENYHKLKLKGNDHVHHLDEDKQNNHIDNLILVSPSNHNRLHGMIDRRDIEGLLEFKENLLKHDILKYETWLKSFIDVI